MTLVDDENPDAAGSLTILLKYVPAEGSQPVIQAPPVQAEPSPELPKKNLSDEAGSGAENDEDEVEENSDM